MNCPVCGQATMVLKTLVLDRRRECTVCHHRFTTTEVLKDEHQRLLEIETDARALGEKVGA